MSLYKIGPIIVEIQCEYLLFQSFLFEDKNVSADINVTFLEKSPKIDNPSQITYVNSVRILKSNSVVPDTKLFFQSSRIQNVISTLSVSADYKKVEFYCPYGSESEIFYSELVYLLQPVIACVAIKKGIVILHAACIFKNHSAMAFSGPSGLGKSTRARQWIELFDFEFLSGDRPWVDAKGRKVIGTPWDGKENVFKNIEVPLDFIFQIERSRITSVHLLNEEEAFKFISTQAFIPMWDVALVSKTFINIRLLVKRIKLYRLCCDQTANAAIETNSIINAICQLKYKELTNMKINDSFEIVKIEDDYMAIPIGNKMENYGGTVILNEVAAFLLNHMEEDISKEQLIDLLLAEYNVTKEIASQDIERIIKKFIELELIAN